MGIGFAPTWLRRMSTPLLRMTTLTAGDVGYLCANFSLPRPLFSILLRCMRQSDRQTDIRRASPLNAPA